MNRSRQLERVLGFAIVAAVTTTSLACAAGGSQQFVFAESGDEPVLTLTIGAGLSGVATTLRAYASGTAEIETIRGGQVIQRVDKVIKSAEMEEILALIAFGGLLDSDEETIIEEMVRLQENPRRHPMAPADSPMFVVTFAIERTNSSSAETQEIRRSVQFQAPDRMAARFPTIRALQTLAQLQARMRVIARLPEEPR